MSAEWTPTSQLREIAALTVVLKAAQAEQVARHVEQGAGSEGGRWEEGTWQQHQVDRWSARRIELGDRAYHAYMDDTRRRIRQRAEHRTGTASEPGWS